MYCGKCFHFSPKCNKIVVQIQGRVRGEGWGKEGWSEERKKNREGRGRGGRRYRMWTREGVRWAWVLVRGGVGDLAMGREWSKIRITY